MAPFTFSSELDLHELLNVLLYIRTRTMLLSFPPDESVYPIRKYQSISGILMRRLQSTIFLPRRLTPRILPSLVLQLHSPPLKLFSMCPHHLVLGIDSLSSALSLPPLNLTFYLPLSNISFVLGSIAQGGSH